jgi:hypothetical protein
MECASTGMQYVVLGKPTPCSKPKKLLYIVIMNDFPNDAVKTIGIVN